MQLSPQLESTLERIVNKTIIAVLIITSFVGLGVFFIVADRNVELNTAYQQAYKQFEIYTVPSSEYRLDIFNNDRIRLEGLTNIALQKMLTFSPSNYITQQNEVKKYLAPNMLVAFNSQFSKKQANKVTNIHQVFTLQSDVNIETTGKQSANGAFIRKVVITGELKSFTAKNFTGKVFTTEEMQVTMELEETSVSKTNPYGFLISKYHTKILD